MQIERDLIKSCISENRNAQKQLYQLLMPYLRSVAMRYLRDNSYLKDALQESFIKIFKNIDQYALEKAPFHSWATRITINSCINYNKRVIGIPKEELILEKHESVSLPDDNDWSDEELLLLLKQMPEGYFEVFNLFAIDGYAHEEIAQILNINEALSRKRLSRSRSWLKKTLLEKPKWLTQYSHPSIVQN